MKQTKWVYILLVFCYLLAQDCKAQDSLALIEGNEYTVHTHSSLMKNIGCYLIDNDLDRCQSRTWIEGHNVLFSGLYFNPENKNSYYRWSIPDKENTLFLNPVQSQNMFKNVFGYLSKRGEPAILISLSDHYDDIFEESKKMGCGYQGNKGDFCQLIVYGTVRFSGNEKLPTNLLPLPYIETHGFRFTGVLSTKDIMEDMLHGSIDRIIALTSLYFTVRK